MHRDRDLVSDRAVGSVLVVVSTPSFQLFRHVRKRQEPVRVQSLGTEAAIERVNDGIVCRCS